MPPVIGYIALAAAAYIIAVVVIGNLVVWTMDKLTKGDQ